MLALRQARAVSLLLPKDTGLLPIHLHSQPACVCRALGPRELGVSSGERSEEKHSDRGFSTQPLTETPRTSEKEPRCVV